MTLFNISVIFFLLLILNYINHEMLKYYYNIKYNYSIHDIKYDGRISVFFTHTTVIFTLALFLYALGIYKQSTIIV